MTRCPACGCPLAIVAAEDVAPTTAELIDRYDPVIRARRQLRIEEIRQIARLNADEYRRADQLEAERDDLGPAR